MRNLRSVVFGSGYSSTAYAPTYQRKCVEYLVSSTQSIQSLKISEPYVCDFPGCTKAFAITGALTIHKRTHSGKKPFKCTYCERQVLAVSPFHFAMSKKVDSSFSESSNLSKHIRTHTGDRPYACSHLGCEKRFARPDQVARHMNVHNKKKPTEGTAADEVANVQDE